MPYTGGRPSDFVNKAVYAATDRLCFAVADRAGDFMTERVRRRVPVKTGRSRASVLKRPTRRRLGVYTSGVRSDYENVRRLEYGTKAHTIAARPGGVLAWDALTPKGRVITGKKAHTIFTTRVKHPGTKGLHMFAIAAAETEAGIQKIATPPLRTWKREVEAAIRTGKHR